MSLSAERGYGVRGVFRDRLFWGSQLIGSVDAEYGHEDPQSQEPTRGVDELALGVTFPHIQTVAVLGWRITARRPRVVGEVGPPATSDPLIVILWLDVISGSAMTMEADLAMI